MQLREEKKKQQLYIPEDGTDVLYSQEGAQPAGVCCGVSESYPSFFLSLSLPGLMMER